MKITLEVPDNKAAFMMELLQSLPFVKAMTAHTKAKTQDETEYLLSNPANAKALTDAIQRLESGQGMQHDLIDA
ncbi:type II toxin-antitoxin system Phd/YefM family antitoxin [Hymenobacter terrestris]|uniref:Type II toxin-antitoxin system antitoxin, RelB/DinJ family n=1 Tax=Hymenobacter terrestris TaxID=2748310 RepID=A0ABX2Q4R5_9BACT|nr:hypothetical protein [Hymenobacter terrestris]NVO85955.1 hypothetical protein [Hymenobacter terrestris]